jgi:hypothetical protein
MSIIFNLIAFAGCSAILEVFRRKGLLDKSEARTDFSEESARQAFPFARTNAQAWIGLGLTFAASCFAIATAMLGIFSPHTVAITSTIQRSTTMNEIIIWLSILGGFSTLGTLGFHFRKEIAGGYRKTRNAIGTVFGFLGYVPKPKSNEKSIRPIDEYLDQVKAVKQITTEVARLNRGTASSVEEIATDLYRHEGPEAKKRLQELDEIKSAFGEVSGEFVAQIETVIGSYMEKMGFSYDASTRRPQAAARTAIVPEAREANKKTSITWAQGFNMITDWFTGGKGDIQLNTASHLYEPFARYYAIRHNSLSDSSVIKSAAPWIEWELQRFTAPGFPAILIIEGQALEELIRGLKLVPGRDLAALPVDGSGIAETSFEGARIVGLSDINRMKGNVGNGTPLPSLEIPSIDFALFA